VDLELTKIEGDFDEELFRSMKCNLLFNGEPYQDAFMRIKLADYKCPLSDVEFYQVRFEPLQCYYDVTKKQLLVSFRTDTMK